MEGDEEITFNLNLEMQNMSKVRRWGDNIQPKPGNAEYVQGKEMRGDNIQP